MTEKNQGVEITDEMVRAGAEYLAASGYCGMNHVDPKGLEPVVRGLYRVACRLGRFAAPKPG